MEMVNLEDVCEIIAGQSPPSVNYNQDGNGMPFFQGKADFNDLFPTVRYWCNKPLKIALPNDILLSVRAPVGPTNLCNQESCIGRGLSAIRAGEKVDYRYLLYFFRANENKLSSQGRGSTFSAITQSEIRSIKFPLTDIKTQQKMAGILEQADVARQKRKQANQLTEQFLQSAFLEMFGDPVRNDKGWEVKNLEEYISFLTSGSRGWAKYYTDEGDLFIRIENVGRSKLFLEQDRLQFVNAPESAESKRTLVQEGDLLISITADLGRTAIVPKLKSKAYINQHLALVRLKKDVNPIFLTNYFSSSGGQSQFNSMNKGGVKAGLNFNDIKSLKFICPPLPLQNKFATFMEKVEQLRVKQSESEKELENLFGSLMQRYFE